MELALLLESNVPSTCKRSAMKIIRNRSNNEETLLTLNNAPGNFVQYAHIVHKS